MSLRSVSKLGRLTALSSGLMFACSAENSEVSDSGGTATMPQGGSGGTTTGGGTSTVGGEATTPGGGTSTGGTGGTSGGTGGTTSDGG
ncbi:MAG: hypothetical protein JXA36_07990, partial [Coriobacteriia bacterium]|nr:hypothetical protein [Coriobacteriia bacterium]